MVRGIDKILKGGGRGHHGTRHRPNFFSGSGSEVGPICVQKRPIFEKRPNVPSKNENDVVLIGAVASIAGWHMKAEINRSILCFDNILIPSLSLKTICISKTSNRRKSKIVLPLKLCRVYTNPLGS